MTKRNKKGSKGPIIAVGAVVLMAGFAGGIDSSEPATAAGDTATTVLTSSSKELSLGAKRARQAHEAGWPKSELVDLLAVGYAESKWDNNAVMHNTNGTVDRCWLQDNSANKRLFKGDSPSNPVGCARIAKRIKAEQGWKAWSTVNNGRYLQFMSKAKAAVAEAGLS